MAETTQTLRTVLKERYPPLRPRPMVRPWIKRSRILQYLRQRKPR